MELPVPKWVEAPITSSQLEGTVPSAAALKLLQNVVKQIITKGETFSVTNSPMLCPAGKNYLLTVKPYFWESPVGSGCWGEWVHCWRCELARTQT
jgi:hypothetical protein